MNVKKSVKDTEGHDAMIKGVIHKEHVTVLEEPPNLIKYKRIMKKFLKTEKKLFSQSTVVVGDLNLSISEFSR